MCGWRERWSGGIARHPTSVASSATSSKQALDWPPPSSAVAEEQARRQVRVNRRLRALMAGVAALAIVAAAGGIVATLARHAVPTPRPMLPGHRSSPLLQSP